MPSQVSLPDEISDDARTLFKLIKESETKEDYVIRDYLQSKTGWKRGRFDDAFAELLEVDAIQNLFIPIPAIAQIVDALGNVMRGVILENKATTLWASRNEEQRSQITTLTAEYISNRLGTARDFHEARRVRMTGEGWRHGDTYSPKDKVAPDLLPWEDMSPAYKKIYETVLSVARLLAREPK